MVPFLDIIIILFLIVKFLNNRTSRNPHPLPPGPYAFPFIGSTIQMLLNKPTFRWIHKLMDEFQTQILCIRLGRSTHVIVVSSPDVACEFLKKQDTVFASRPDMLCAYLISEGYKGTIFSPFGNQWKKMRNVINHNILSSKTYKWLQPIREDEASHLLLYICNQIGKQDGGLVNIRIVSQHFCGNLIRRMIFGKRFFGNGRKNGGPGEEETEHIDAIFTILKYVYAFCITDYFSWLRQKFDFDGHERIMRTAIQHVRKYQDPLIDARIQMWNDKSRNKVHDLLDVLITQDNPKLSANEIKVQILELMLATVDNPSNAIEWAMAEMINEPTLLKRATDELDHVVGHDRLVDERDIPHLNYIKACIKEAFRLHPFAPLNVPHVSLTDTTVAGYFIPKGSHVLLSRCGLGRNPKVWKNPMRFDPDRHLRNDGNQVVLSDSELRMISFSTGKRGCPGVQLGSTITTMCFARMLQGFTWELPHNEPGIKLLENHDELSLANPLVLIAKPRLPCYLYPKI